MQYFLLTVSTLLLALNFTIQKVYQRRQGTSSASSFGFNALLGLCTAILFFFINGCKIGFSWFSLIGTILFNGLVVSYTIIGFKLLQRGTIAMYTLFLMSGGMTVPYIYGLLFLGEPFSVQRTVALILMLTGVILSNIGKEKVDVKSLLMCISVFIINGFTSVVSKVHQIETVFPTVNTTEFVLLGGICKFIFAGILYVTVRKQSRQKEEKSFFALPLFLIIASALASGVSSLLQLLGAKTLPATVLYPFITGGSIVASSLAGVLFFKEKLSKNLIVGIILCFVSTLLFL